MKPGHADAVHVLALGMLAAGAYMDSHATSLTRPEQMYVSQALVAAGTALSCRRPWPAVSRRHSRKAPATS